MWCVLAHWQQYSLSSIYKFYCLVSRSRLSALNCVIWGRQWRALIEWCGCAALMINNDKFRKICRIQFQSISINSINWISRSQIANFLVSALANEILMKASSGETWNLFIRNQHSAWRKENYCSAYCIELTALILLVILLAIVSLECQLKRWKKRCPGPLQPDDPK